MFLQDFIPTLESTKVRCYKKDMAAQGRFVLCVVTVGGHLHHLVPVKGFTTSYNTLIKYKSNRGSACISDYDYENW